MTPFDAYEDEMRNLPRLTDREIDRLLDGKPPTGDATEDLAKVVRDVRLAYVAPPAEATEARHLAAMAEAARLSDTEAPAAAAVSERAHRSRLAFARKGAMTRNRSVFLAAKLAAATLVAALATGGLAAAGVISLPDLPGQEDDTAKNVRDAIHGSNPAEQTCAFGLEVARVASDGKVDVDGAACGSAQARGDRGRDGAERAGERRSSARGGRVGAQGGVDTEKLRNFGQKTAGRTPGKTGQHGRDFGTDTAKEAYELVPKPAPAPQSPTAADPPTGGGQESGEGFSQGGREVGDNAAGGRVP